MKRSILAVCVAIFSLTVFGQLKMATSGNIGIGKDPASNKVEINGTTKIYNSSVSSLLITTSGGWYGPSIEPTGHNVCNLGQSNHGFRHLYVQTVTITSDIRHKENIRNIDGALDLVLKLNAIKYDIKKEKYTDAYNLGSKDMERIEESRKNLLGFSAQEVEKIIPEVVSYDDSTDIYGIDYIRLVPILAQAIKEQNAKIVELEARLNDNGNKKGAIMGESSPIAFLGQNMPNPFTENTLIEFYLRGDIQKAVFYVYDLQGKQIKHINISEREYGSVTISGNELTPGIYQYSIIADGQIIGIEQMILTD
jgi:hypothetical protein